MFTHLLVPLDRSTLAECVLPHVVAMARAFESRITLLHVAEPPELDSEAQPVDPVQWEMIEAANKIYLDDIADKLRDMGLAAESVLLEGDAADSIVTFAHRNDVDLIVLSSHGHSGMSRWTLSSVAQKLVMQAAISILIIRAYQTGVDVDTETAVRYSHILAPLDGSARADYVLPAVDALANYFDADVQLVHVVRQPEMPRRAPPTEEEESLSERVTAVNRTVATEYLEQSQSQLTADTAIRLLESEDVTAALYDWIQQTDVDLIVLNAHGYSGSTQWPYGSVTNNFITYGHVPLLIVQDIAREDIAPTAAQLAAREQAGHA